VSIIMADRERHDPYVRAQPRSWDAAGAPSVDGSRTVSRSPFPFLPPRSSRAASAEPDAAPGPTPSPPADMRYPDLVEACIMAGRADDGGSMPAILGRQAA
jgi:hypothetical protein